MERFAKINIFSKKVEDVIEASEEYIKTLPNKDFWVSCNDKVGVSFTYNPENNTFIPPRPYLGWSYNTVTTQWESPIPYPNIKEFYKWNEETQNWDLIEPE